MNAGMSTVRESLSHRSVRVTDIVVAHSSAENITFVVGMPPQLSLATAFTALAAAPPAENRSAKQKGIGSGVPIVGGVMSSTVAVSMQAMASGFPQQSSPVNSIFTSTGH